MLAWLSAEERLTNDALTVRAQTISPNDQGNLLWDVFFPRRDVDSVEIHEITTLDFRPVADRREWNQRGRKINLRVPPFRDMEMVPIESTFSIAEREIQKFQEQTLGNEDLFRQIVGASIPDRTDMLVMANWRRVEVDAHQAWATGQIPVRDPNTGATYTASFGFDPARYQTAATAWNNVGVNAYDELISWLESAEDAIGPVAGVVLRRATFNEIQRDAPNAVTGTVVPRLTREMLRQRVSDELGTDFQFYIVENSFDVYTGGGQTTARQKVWPAQRIAAVPQGLTVGSMAFAPVARAFEIARNAPQAGVDIRGVTVFSEMENGGRGMTVEAQLNAMPIPDEQRLYVINVGV